MVDEIQFGEPRGFPLKKHTVESIRAMSIPRCGKCGRRVESTRNGEWCDLCLKETALSSFSPSDQEINHFS